MNYKLSHLPNREKKPRQKKGITMIMDKGLSTAETHHLIDSSGDLIDLVKFGFGTSYITKNLKEKLEIYKNAKIKCYLGGTIFEAFVSRGMFDDYRQLLDKFKLEVSEVSDGCINISLEKKIEYIKTLSKQSIVISEVGSKDENIDLPEKEWIVKMNAELQAGSWKVIAEARESGTIGIFDKKGEAKKGMIDLLDQNVGYENIIWETPKKAQQVYFIKKFGTNVNLGNIAPEEVIPLETLRLGLRGDTFFLFLPEEIKTKYKK